MIRNKFENNERKIDSENGRFDLIKIQDTVIPNIQDDIAKDIADLILTYDGDDYIPLVALDLFGDEMFSFVEYIKYNIENVSNN